MAEKLMRHVTNAANVLKASSFVLACDRTVCVRSPYSLKSRGGSHIQLLIKANSQAKPYKILLPIVEVPRNSSVNV